MKHSSLSVLIPFNWSFSMAEENHLNENTKSYIALTNGTAISHYRIIEKIGSGGMGEVYLAEDTNLNRKVALKFLPSHLCQEEECRARFKLEAQAAAKLNHPNIIHIYEVSEFQGRPFISMELVEAGTLKGLIGKDDVPLVRLLEILIQICDGLNEAHNSGVIHRDIKPSNILLDKNGNPHISDFGLARVKGAKHITKSGSTFGTIGYMSPEQVKGEKADQRSDIFSLGVVIYELVTGRQPFMKNSEAATLNSILNDTPDPLARFRSNIPDELQPIIAKALEKDAEIRFQHIDDLRADLTRVKRQEDFEQSDRKLTGPSSRPQSSTVIITIGLIFILSILMLIPSFRRPLLRLLGFATIPLEKHLAVLPFIDSGADTSGQVLNDGLLEILTSKLCQLEQFHGTLKVIPASEIRMIGANSAREARQALGATLAVSGSLHRYGDSLEMMINLIDAEQERQLRSSTFKNSLAHISSFQDSALFIIARMLEIQLRPNDKSFLSAGGTASPEAYYYYLEGVSCMQRTEKTECIDSAIELYQQSITMDNEYALGYAELGKAYWRKFQTQKEPEWLELARVNCMRAIALNEKLPQAHVTLGLIYTDSGMPDSAVEIFERALHLDSSNYLAYRGLAEAYRSMNRLEMAETTYLKEIKARPDYWGGYYGLAWFYIGQGRKQDALWQVQKILDLEPIGFHIWNNLGALYYYLGLYDDARRMWEHSLELDSNYGAYSNLGALNYLEMHYTDAAAMYENALRLNDQDYKVWINLAGVYNKMDGRKHESQNTYQRAIRMAEAQKAVNPRDPELLSHLAECYAEIGEDSKAVAYVEQLLQIAPSNMVYWVSVGFVYEAVGKRDLALEWIGKALRSGYPYEQIKRLPELQGLLADPRFEEVLKSDSIAAN
jgi:serine/threonine protein kinase/Tfp pilus assembly protein PilF